MQTLRKYSKLSKEVRPVTGCRRRAPGKTKKRTGGFGGHGFLTHRFAPLMEDEDGILKNKTKVERDFFKSLHYLCSLYQIPVPLVQNHPFPLNIQSAYEEVKQQLTALFYDVELAIIQTDEQAACLTTVKTYSTGTTLFYVPVRPLIDMLADPAQQSEAELLLYTFAYLYHVIDVPWFQDTGHFLDYTYDMLESWYMDADEPEDKEATLETLAIFERMRTDGNALQTRIHYLKNLNGWNKCLRAFMPVTPEGQAIKKVAQTAWELHKAYPGRSIWQSIEPGLLYPECEERVCADYYLSFFWDSEDDLYYTLMENVNVSLQEYGATDEPVNCQIFDKPHSTVTLTLAFEQKLFELIDELCTVLNKSNQSTKQ